MIKLVTFIRCVYAKEDYIFESPVMSVKSLSLTLGKKSGKKERLLINHEYLDKMLKSHQHFHFHSYFILSLLLPLGCLRKLHEL